MKNKSTKSLKEDFELTRRKFVQRVLVGAFATTSVSMRMNFTFAAEASVDKDMMRTIAIIADTLLPRTASPSATDVSAHIFVTEFVDAGKGPEFNARFYNGLSLLKIDAENQYHKNFEDISIDKLTMYLGGVLETPEESDKYWFLFRFKQLLLVGWALCKETAESAFAYQGGIYQYLPNAQSSQIIMSNYIDREYLSL